MENLFLIVGLGNPGREYAGTRHNAGFMLADRLARQWGAEWTADSKFRALVARAQNGLQNSLLCKPQTFMNASGETVGALVEFYKCPVARLLVAVDDADLSLGQVRLRGGGSSGGHHGLESIEQHLATREFARLRIGIGRRAEAREITGHVLGKFGADETALLEKVLQRAADQAGCWMTKGLEAAMNEFNGVLDSTNEGTKQ